ncbi:polysaccharide pyruvyl transferase family protein [Oharaeibacter diazotrophicus]|uniref:Polysaccharide pyruvyl transferase n=1 Tax=Oharaeibacter diazotrophicus TaxID=1920512 RepID=A0A4R6R6S1_9HYPH|nr:polysaccharide pyruvyl transferase family protein [Oharaeibacter diazotrophicus]TDP81504.1 polysaccharide pyruvyl transferase [Oharaeibacter diazotrophicus]BBE73742.1 polysaccharide pyruvyl transferase [Pleomorphomonas sp. SM30]GLS75532.1 hypothetical protein GCM10007904_08670 [Oharaeibacter diazotrophicus]
MTSDLRALVRDTGCVPLGWAGSSEEMDYLNWGDAMSPVMVALLTGLPIERVPFRSVRNRLAAVGTVAHGFEGGTVTVWGSGCSPHANPRARPAERIPYAPPPGTRIEVAATRGPLSAARLGGAEAAERAAFGDPVWLLPRFYRPAVAKTHELGVILHLSELADRAHEARPKSGLAAYDLAGVEGVRLINTCTPVSAEGLRAWVDEVASCRRIVSTSLHGMVVAESYGIPCLPLVNGREGLADVDLAAPGPVDDRFVDLYRGLGLARLSAYARQPGRRIAWKRLIAAIDATWTEKTLDEDRLVAALPLDLAPLSAPPGGTVFDLPAIRDIRFRHDVRALARAEKAARSGGLVGALRRLLPGGRRGQP